MQTEAKKLQRKVEQSEDLKGKYEATSKELEDTKDNLSNLMGQLADRSSSASETERKVAEATKKLEVSFRNALEWTFSLTQLQALNIRM